MFSGKEECKPGKVHLLLDTPSIPSLSSACVCLGHRRPVFRRSTEAIGMHAREQSDRANERQAAECGY